LRLAGVLKRTANIFLLIAMLAVTGGHWAVLQTVAWTTMLAGSVGTDSFAAAVHNTFDGKHPCCLCKQIAAGKQTEKKSEFTPQFKPPEFLPVAPRFIFAAPSYFVTLPTAGDFFKSVCHTPPTPPPRAAFA
jgi:hypothetical protein